MHCYKAVKNSAQPPRNGIVPVNSSKIVVETCGHIVEVFDRSFEKTERYAVSSVEKAVVYPKRGKSVSQFDPRLTAGTPFPRRRYAGV